MTCIPLPDDLPWVLKYAGEQSLVIGTDYGHLDPSSDTNAIGAFKQLEEISQDTKERIRYHNPKALYHLSRFLAPARGRLGLPTHCAVEPPSMTSSLPVTKDDSSEARYSTP
jgi:hypothetical protein